MNGIMQKFKVATVIERGVKVLCPCAVQTIMFLRNLKVEEALRILTHHGCVYGHHYCTNT